MTDTPKRRGRPPKVRSDVNDIGAEAWVTSRLRWKPSTGFQQAWQHPTGTQWRDVPVVPESAPDWEDGA